MKKASLKVVIVATAIVLSLFVVGLSFAAWVLTKDETDTGTINTGNIELGFDGNVEVAYFSDLLKANEVTASDIELFPLDQTDVSTLPTNGAILIEAKVVFSTDVKYQLGVELKSTSLVAGKVYFAKTLPTAVGDGTEITATNQTIDSGNSATEKEVVVYIWFESTSISDMGKDFVVNFTLVAETNS